MSQVKIYGIRERLGPIKRELSDVIHECVVEALDFPTDKRFHRFFPFKESDFYYPPGRTTAYTIIEISMFQGRSVEAKKRLIGLLLERISAKFGISLQDIEITNFETPKHNWGIRGLPGVVVHGNLALPTFRWYPLYVVPVGWPFFRHLLGIHQKDLPYI